MTAKKVGCAKMAWNRPDKPEDFYLNDGELVNPESDKNDKPVEMMLVTMFPPDLDNRYAHGIVDPEDEVVTKTGILHGTLLMLPHTAKNGEKIGYQIYIEQGKKEEWRWDGRPELFGPQYYKANIIDAVLATRAEVHDGKRPRDGTPAQPYMKIRTDEDGIEHYSWWTWKGWEIPQQLKASGRPAPMTILDGSDKVIEDKVRRYRIHGIIAALRYDEAQIKDPTKGVSHDSTWELEEDPEDPDGIKHQFVRTKRSIDLKAEEMAALEKKGKKMEGLKQFGRDVRSAGVSVTVSTFTKKLLLSDDLKKSVSASAGKIAAGFIPVIPSKLTEGATKIAAQVTLDTLGKIFEKGGVDALNRPGAKKATAGASRPTYLGMSATATTLKMNLSPAAPVVGTETAQASVMMDLGFGENLVMGAPNSDALVLRRRPTKMPKQVAPPLPQRPLLESSSITRPQLTITNGRTRILNHRTRSAMSVDRVVRYAGYDYLKEEGKQLVETAPDPSAPNVARYAVRDSRNQRLNDNLGKLITLGADAIDAFFGAGLPENPRSEQSGPPRSSSSQTPGRGSAPQDGDVPPGTSAARRPTPRPIVTTMSSATGVLIASPESTTAAVRQPQIHASSSPVVSSPELATIDPPEEDIYNDSRQGSPALRASTRQAEQPASTTQAEQHVPTSLAAPFVTPPEVVDASNTSAESLETREGPQVSTTQEKFLKTPQAPRVSPTRGASIDSPRAARLVPAILTARALQQVMEEAPRRSSTTPPQEKPVSTTPQAERATTEAAPVPTTRGADGADSDLQPSSLAAAIERVLADDQGWTIKEARAWMSDPKNGRVIASKVPAVVAELSAAREQARSTPIESAQPTNPHEATAPPASEVAHPLESSAPRPLTPRKARPIFTREMREKLFFVKPIGGPSTPSIDDRTEGGRRR